MFPPDFIPRLVRGNNSNSPNAFRLRSLIVWVSACRLDLPELPHIPLAPGQANAIEILADRHGVLAGGCQKVAQVGHGHGRAVGKALDHLAAKLGFDVEIEVKSG